MFRSLTECVRWLGLMAGAMAFTGCGVTLTPPGFVHEHRHSVTRGWFDFNSYRRPSFTFERYDHLPPSSARVKLFSWLHGGSVEKTPQVVIWKDTDQTYYGSVDNSTLTECPTLISPVIPSETVEEPMDSTPAPIVPLPAPPSEPEEPAFPEINAPKPEITDSIATVPPESEDGQLKVVMWLETVDEEAPAESGGNARGIPFIPPPPAPPIE